MCPESPRHRLEEGCCMEIRVQRCEQNMGKGKQASI